MEAHTAAEDGRPPCRTPRQERRTFPADSRPPPPPRKKPAVYSKRRIFPPKEGYFHPPDLEVFFDVAYGRLQESDDCSR